ncbi:hypothetical protein MID13_01790 [Vibrio gigantis]|uniref:DUF6701 domain-containing protein n=1 Tax=Vibrio gigantis TaxID=296199 RepID=UPI001EFB7215|nr:DUF6701 domain-containing protein [Vibrio gigantis]ULN64579.1 hypothetical protein MID13_01790 [Vibrio gigantis]
MKMKYLLGSVLVLLMAFQTQASDFPFPGGSCPLKTSVNTWSAFARLDLDKRNAVIGALDGNKVAFYSSSIDDNAAGSCGNGVKCVADSSLVLAESPQFISFNNSGATQNPKNSLSPGSYKKVKIHANRSVDFEGDYYINTLELYGSGSEIVVTGPTRLFVHDFTMEGWTKITVQSGNPDDLIIVASNEPGTRCDLDFSTKDDASCADIRLETTDSTPIYAHLFSEDEIDLQGSTQLHGTATGFDVDIETNARLTTSMGSCEEITPPPVNDEPKFQVGTVTQCQISDGIATCRIPFDEVYDEPPLVFLMPTIDASKTDINRQETEYPSSVRVVSVDNSQAIIKQYLAPHSNASSKPTYVESPMLDVDYFVIEPGVIQLNGGTIVAGFVNTMTTTEEGDKYDDKVGDKVEFSTFGLNGFPQGELPGVLVEPQSIINTASDGRPQWVTGYAGHVTENDFLLALDKSGVGDNDDDYLTQLEKVAFVAGFGEGYVDGKKFWLGSGSTTATNGGENEKIYGPVTIGCRDGITDIRFAGFRTPPVLVASKNSRNGGNGGWLRRCSISKDEVVFIVEEDMEKDAERAHKSEEAAFFMFEKDLVTEHCSLFPSATQTWKGAPNAGLTVWDYGYIENATDYKYVGFDQSQMTAVSTSSCLQADGTRSTCVSDDDASFPYDKRLMLEHEPLWPSAPPSSSLKDIPSPDTNGVVFLPPGNYRTLSDNTNIYSRIIFEAGKYWFEGIELGGTSDAVLDVSHGLGITKIETKNVAIAGTVTINHTGTPDNLQITATGAALGTVALSSNNEFNALILAETRVEIGGNTIVRGSVTAPIVTINSNGRLVGDSSCFDKPEPPGKLVVEVKQLNVLTCEVAAVEFRVEDDLGNIVTSVQDAFIASASPAPNARWCENDSDLTTCSNYGTSLTSQFIDGKKTLYLSSSHLNKTGYEVSGTWNDETAKPVPNTKVSFVPYKFDVAEQLVVAGKPQQVTTKVLSCDAQNAPKSQDYVGKPDVLLNIELPLNGDGHRDLLKFDPEFIQSDDGEVQDPLTIQESGQFRVTLNDSSYDCSELSGCPPEGTDKLSGSFIVKSRPWTFAVCPPPSTNGTGGDAFSGLGFVAAGEPFNLYVKPVVWDSNLDVIESESNLPLRLVQKKSTRSFCSLDVTRNFFVSSDDLNTRVDLKNSLATPNDKALGRPYQGGVDNFSNTAELEFADISVTEVGSFHFTASASHDFYDQIPNGSEYGIEDGAREIGRFYPKYFRVIAGNEWYYPGRFDGDEQSFVYMNQPFEGASFQVEAFNAYQQAVQNYAFFDSRLTADFTLYSPNYGTRLKVPSMTKSWASDPNRSVGTFTIERSSPSINCDSELCWEKGSGASYPDGPFNSGVQSTSISITDIGLGNIDPVIYSQSSLTKEELRKLSNQPDIRFGRMLLDSAGGVAGESVRVPLRVEFWDSNLSRFVVNTDDSHTDFSGVKAGQAFIWPDDGNDTDVNLGLSVASKGTGKVKDGVSGDLVASQTAAHSQQTQVWLDLGSPNNLPWLRYAWGDDDDNATDYDGEQDPSTVVTFGIYRGNDRVIYRGESGLTGQ